MNILWIEDQPGEHEKQLFPKHLIDGTVHHLVKTTSFDDAYTKVESAHEDVDFVVIDINLEHFHSGNQGNKLMLEFKLSEKGFLEEAGFHLYLRLLQQGFNRDQIIFLTAYTVGNQFDELHRRLSEALFESDERKIDVIFQEIEKAIAESSESLDELQQAITHYDQTGSSAMLHNLLDALAEKEKEKSDIKDSSQNRYGKFDKTFKEARLSLAKSIKKTRYEDFHRWLAERLDPRRNREFRYTILRRAIIEGCRELRKKVEHIKSEELENYLLFYKTTNIQVSEDQRNYFIDYLIKLETFFPLRLSRNKQQMYSLFLKELSAEREMSGQNRLERSLKAQLGFSEFEYRFKSHCQAQMKLLRNWTVHDLLSRELDEKIVAYLFMIAMRSWLNVPIDQIFPYEMMLADLFDQTEELKSDILQELSESYYALRNMLHQKRYHQNPYGNEFTDLLRMFENLGDSRKEDLELIRVANREKFAILFYQHYWHGLFPADLKIAHVRPDKKGIAMFINFKETKGEHLHKIAFLHFLGRLILREAFPRE